MTAAAIKPTTKPTLYYAHDPMCSWCWGFRPVYRQLLEQLPAAIEQQRLLGGLAPDSDEPMAQTMQLTLQQTWHKIEQTIAGTRFNFDFWSLCQPRRSTWPACRAIIAARMQGDEYDPKMTLAIQTAYYLQARNPADDSTLIELAAEIGLDVALFTQTLDSPFTATILEQERTDVGLLGISGFPALVLRIDQSAWRLPLDYNQVEPMLSVINRLLDSGSS